MTKSKKQLAKDQEAREDRDFRDAMRLADALENLVIQNLEAPDNVFTTADVMLRCRYDGNRCAHVLIDVLSRLHEKIQEHHCTLGTKTKKEYMS